mmetsp:Transcript_103894/g.155566  ORF Transcript_103894/g.155566 Transcript_103894/m.155566 type:complete len:240 (-) Transcript_103894:233-952(-)
MANHRHPNGHEHNSEINDLSISLIPKKGKVHDSTRFAKLGRSTVECRGRNFVEVFVRSKIGFVLEKGARILQVFGVQGQSQKGQEIDIFRQHFVFVRVTLAKIRKVHRSRLDKASMCLRIRQRPHLTSHMIARVHGRSVGYQYDAITLLSIRGQGSPTGVVVLTAGNEDVRTRRNVLIQGQIQRQNGGRSDVTTVFVQLFRQIEKVVLQSLLHHFEVQIDGGNIRDFGSRRVIPKLLKQ